MMRLLAVQQAVFRQVMAIVASVMVNTMLQY